MSSNKQDLIFKNLINQVIIALYNKDEHAVKKAWNEVCKKGFDKKFLTTNEWKEYFKYDFLMSNQIASVDEACSSESCVDASSSSIAMDFDNADSNEACSSQSSIASSSSFSILDINNLPDDDSIEKLTLAQFFFKICQKQADKIITHIKEERTSYNKLKKDLNNFSNQKRGIQIEYLINIFMSNMDVLENPPESVMELNGMFAKDMSGEEKNQFINSSRGLRKKVGPLLISACESRFKQQNKLLGASQSWYLDMTKFFYLATMKCLDGEKRVLFQNEVNEIAENNKVLGKQLKFNQKEDGHELVKYYEGEELDITSSIILLSDMILAESGLKEYLASLGSSDEDVFHYYSIIHYSIRLSTQMHRSFFVKIDGEFFELDGINHRLHVIERKENYGTGSDELQRNFIQNKINDKAKFFHAMGEIKPEDIQFMNHKNKGKNPAVPRWYSKNFDKKMRSVMQKTSCAIVAKAMNQGIVEFIINDNGSDIKKSVKENHYPVADLKGVIISKSSINRGSERQLVVDQYEAYRQLHEQIRLSLKNIVDIGERKPYFQLQKKDKILAKANSESLMFFSRSVKMVVDNEYFTDEAMANRKQSIISSCIAARRSQGG